MLFVNPDVIGFYILLDCFPPRPMALRLKTDTPAMTFIDLIRSFLTAQR